MNHHLGRLIDHVHLRVADVDASKRFYLAVVTSLGRRESLVEGDGYFYVDELFVDKADGRMVSAFHQAALDAGGRDNGPPGERSYHPGYYGAFVMDPDNIEAVFHGESRRSAESVVVTPADG